MKVSIIVPVYNEEGFIQQVIEELLGLGFDKEIIIIDDGSTDNSRAILRRYESNKEIRLVYHKNNKGKGCAIKTGVSEATGDYIIIKDADLEQSSDEIENFFPEIEKGYEAVFGTRVLEWGDKYNIRHTANLLFTILLNALFKAHLTDIMTGYKMIKTDLFKSLRLDANGFNIEPEITIRVIEKGVSIREVPVSYSARSIEDGKKIRVKDSFSIIFTIIRLRFIAYK
jgi:glycosyltransferase involved in cell wall biosynthesis